MGKYQRSYRQQQSKPRPWKVHPVWRGIGCIFMILIPVLSYVGGVMLVKENAKQGWMSVPAELTNSFFIPLLGQVSYAYLAATIALMVIGFGILVLFYAIIYGSIGPSRYGPLDSPPIRQKKRPRR